MTWTTFVDRDLLAEADLVACGASQGLSCATWCVFGAKIFLAVVDCESFVAMDSMSAVIGPFAGRDLVPMSVVCGVPWTCCGCDALWSVVSTGGDRSVVDCDLLSAGGGHDHDHAIV